jgi:hypothetical protein
MCGGIDLTSAGRIPLYMSIAVAVVGREGAAAVDGAACALVSALGIDGGPRGINLRPLEGTGLDDRLLPVGSSNFDNRSMGFDSGCDVRLDADPKRASVQIGT